MNKKLKNIILVISAIFVTLSLCCCRNKDEDTPPANEGHPDNGETVELSEKEKTANKANNIFSALKDSVSQSSATSISDFLSRIGGANFSVSEFSGGDGSMLPSDALIFKDSTLYVLGSIVDGETVTPMTSITKIYENGILAINTENGGTSASTTILGTDTEKSASEIAKVFDALTVKENDLVETDVPTTFTLSQSYIEKLEKAIKDTQLFGNDFYINGAAVNTEKLESEGEITLTLDRAFTDIDLQIKFAKSDSADGTKALSIAVTADDLEIKAAAKKLANNTEEIKIEFAKQETKLTFETSVANSTSKQNAFSINVFFSLEGTEQPISCSASLDIENSSSGSLGRVSGDIELNVADELSLSGKLLYDSSVLSAVNQKPFTLDATVTAKGKDEEKLSISVTTVKASASSKEYLLTVSSEGKSDTVPLTATINSPSVIDPTLNENEKKYLERGDLFFLNYESNVKKMDALTEKVKEIASKRNPFRKSCSYYTRDEETGLIFFTDITVESNYISAITTQYAINYEDYLYFYRENDGSFSTSLKSGAERDALALKDEIESAVPDGFTVIDYGAYWTYTYIEAQNFYLAIRGTDESTAIFLTEEPINVTIGNKPVHKLNYDESGDAKIHSFFTEYTEDCKLMYRCEICNFTLRSNEITHNYSIKEEVFEGETLLWTLDYCERCDEGSLVIHDTAGCTFTLAVKKTASKYIPFNKDIYNEIITAEANSEENLFVIFDITHNANEVCTGHEKLEIPAIGESCEYKLIGVTSNTENDNKHSCEGVDTLVLSDEIKFLGYYAFSSASYKNVTLPKSLLYIGNDAFSYCKRLTDIAIPDRVTVIGASAFEGCSAITEITLPESLKSIYGSTFSYCTSLQKINLPKGITEIIDEAFVGCSALKEITLHEGLTTIGQYAFNNCIALEKISLPNGLTTIGKNAFKGCIALKSICVPESVTEIGEKAFEGCTALTAATVCGNIGKYAFRNCTSLYEVTVLADSETIIGSEVFIGCTSLSYVTLSEGISEINSKAFYECTSLKSVIIPGSIKSIRDYVFYGCTSLAEVTVSEGITYIGSVFHECNNISTITLPSTLKRIGSTAFWNCNNIENVYYNGSIEEWLGITFEQESSNPLFGGSNLYCKGELITEVALPEGITKVPDRVFIGCKSITTVSIPDGVTEIGWHAFKDCTSLNKVVLPESVSEIGPYAFQNCSTLSEINLSESITSISAHTFDNCSSLSGTLSLTSLKFLGNSAFKNCSGLSEVILYEGITTISGNAFSGCTALEKITLPTSLEFIIQDAFTSCTALKDIYYAGSAEDFEKIQIISTGNDILSSAAVHYNYSYEE